MPTHADFLQAILADPDDDTPRLIYADWLEEHGDPRGEFIRVQCELAKMRYDDPERDLLVDREQALLAMHQEHWRAELPQFEGLTWIAFHRGFMAEIASKDHESFLCAQREISGITPIQYLELGMAFRAIQVQQLMASTYFRQVRGLGMYHMSFDVGKLAKSRGFCHLRHLHLSRNWISNTGVKRLATSSNVTGLTHCLFRINEIGNPGAADLAASPYLEKLVYLDLAHNRISAVGARALATSPFLQNIQVLDLRNNDIVEPGLSQLRERFGARVRLGSQ